MLLAIDIGNTNTVFALFEAGVDKARAAWRCQTVSVRTADEYGAYLIAWLGSEGIVPSQIDDVMISSVVPDADFHLSGFCRKYLSCTPVFITKDIVPIAIDLHRPEDVGADRLVNAYAVTCFYSYPAIVLDFGTATTFDVVDAKGRYAGGVIAPGIHLSLEALNRAAAKLPKIAIKRPAQALGKSTVGAMQSGIYWGYMGMIEGILRKLTAEIGGNPLVIATGGLASLFVQEGGLPCQIDDELTLKGLSRMYGHLNQANKQEF
jgi:type III pantothenate kinase